MGAMSLQAVYDLPKVEALLAGVDEFGALNDGDRSIGRNQAILIILAVLWGYSARNGSTASGYAHLALWEALGVDFFKSTIVRLPLPATPTDTKPAGEGEGA